jgi:hypothetical protein
MLGSTEMPTESLLHVIQPLVHYGLHLLFPGLVAWLFFREQYKRAWLIMASTMMVDLDHLFAYPDVFVSDRCGIGFHPLHSFPAIVVYSALVWVPRLRLPALGLLLHMATDFQDCMWMQALR